MSRAHDFPILATRRLRLVVPEARHYEDFRLLHNDPCTMRYVGDGMPLDRVDAWLHLATLIGHWQLRGYGVWMAEDLDGRFVGRVGLIRPGNAASRKVALKLGAVAAETVAFLGGPVQILRYRRDH